MHNGDEVPSLLRVLMAVSGSWPVMSAGETGLDWGNVGRSGCAHARIVDVRVIVIVCAWVEDGFVGRAPLLTADVHLPAICMEFGSGKHHDRVEYNDLAAD